MGDKAEDILHSTNISEDESKVYYTMLKKVDQFFKVQKFHLQKPNLIDYVKETSNRPNNSSQTCTV